MKKFILKQLLFLGISIVGWFIASGKIFNNLNLNLFGGDCAGTPGPCFYDTFVPNNHFFGLSILILGLIFFIIHPIATSIRLLNKKNI